MAGHDECDVGPLTDDFRRDPDPLSLVFAPIEETFAEACCDVATAVAFTGDQVAAHLGA